MRYFGAKDLYIKRTSLPSFDTKKAPYIYTHREEEERVVSLRNRAKKEYKKNCKRRLSYHHLYKGIQEKVVKEARTLNKSVIPTKLSEVGYLTNQLFAGK
ncbi:hypothetical protein K1719_007345 [Acacia pycnantha]|nr:hypothetical protein K1719_007345 [Acacia pycnantha]